MRGQLFFLRLRAARRADFFSSWKNCRKTQYRGNTILIVSYYLTADVPFPFQLNAISSFLQKKLENARKILLAAKRCRCPVSSFAIDVARYENLELMWSRTTWPARGTAKLVGKRRARGSVRRQFFLFPTAAVSPPGK